MESTPHIKGIRIRILNQAMLIFSIILFIVVFYTTIKISQEYTKTLEAIDNYFIWEKAAHGVHTGSDLLTRHIQLYTQTLNKDHADNYLDELYTKRTREKAINMASKSHDLNGNAPTLQKALKLSNELAAHEIYAIRLIAEATGQDPYTFDTTVANTELKPEDKAKTSEEKIKLAREIVFGSNYQKSKEGIIDALSTVLDKNVEAARDSEENAILKLGSVLFQQRIALVALCLLNILTFWMIITLIIKPLQVYLKCIRNDKMFELVGAYEFKHLALTYNDIFAVKEHHDKMLKHMAEHDPLTGLLNRAAFDSVRQLLANNPQPVGLILMDVDKFKTINDTYGHKMGDKVLCRVAWLLQHSFRSDDLCIRLGGDEFVIVLHGFDKDIKNIIMEKVHFINDTLQQPQEDLPKVTMSVGVAISQRGFTDNLYEQADAALYDVKKAGRNGCRFYQDIQDNGKE